MKLSRRRLSRTLAAGALVAGVATLAPQALARGRVETPKYVVEATYGAIEVRRYEPRIVAEVAVTGTGKDASSAGFRVLADYIFGNNESQAEIAMTAPVDRSASASESIAMTAPVERSEVAGGESWIVAFTMPSKYTLETLPKPRNSSIRIRELPPMRYAVVRFSGAPAEAKVQARTQELLVAVEAAGLRSSGAAPSYARYDPPWTPSFLRRNELSVELAAQGPTK